MLSLSLNFAKYKAWTRIFRFQCSEADILQKQNQKFDKRFFTRRLEIQNQYKLSYGTLSFQILLFRFSAVNLEFTEFHLQL